MLTGREWELWYLIMDLHRTGKAPGFGKDKLLCLWLHTWRPNACVHKNAVRWRRGESLGIRNKGMERKENPDCTQQGNYLPILRRLPPTDRRWASLRSSGPHSFLSLKWLERRDAKNSFYLFFNQYQEVLESRRFEFFFFGDKILWGAYYLQEEEQIISTCPETLGELLHWARKDEQALLLQYPFFLNLRFMRGHC